MIYITGDTHGQIERFLSEPICSMTKDDVLIICGDFGFIFATEQYSKDIIEKENANLEKLKRLPFRVLFVLGNHENYDRLEALPQMTLYGETVRKISDNIFQLLNGNVYTIQKKTFFCFGGASSVDKFLRTEHQSWWSQELPTDNDYRTATKSLKKYNYNFDYIISHTAPVEVIKLLGFNPYLSDDLELTSFLSFVAEKCSFDKQFFGHFHVDEELELIKSNLFDPQRTINDSVVSKPKHFRAIYKDIVAL